jgi:hypothetical protein
MQCLRGGDHTTTGEKNGWCLEVEEGLVVASDDLLKIGNNSLLQEQNNAQYRVGDLESELASVKKSVAGDVAALEERLAAAEARAAEVSPPRKKIMWLSPATWHICTRHMSTISGASAAFAPLSLVRHPRPITSAG